MQARIYECGNDFPEVGAFVYAGHADGKVYRVTWVDGVGSTIFTTRDKSGWWLAVEVEEADWADAHETFPAKCVLAAAGKAVQS